MKSHSILAPMFGPIGDSLMAIAFFDDILRLDPHASFCMITRHNASIIADLAHAYQQIEVRQIPSGFASIPFFLKLLREPRTLVALGVAERYSLHLKMFFFIFGLCGNSTMGFGDLSSNEGKGWLPLGFVLPLVSDIPILQQYRALLLHLGFSAAEAARIDSRPLHVLLRKSMPKSFPFKKGEYIVVHPFASSFLRTFSTRRWKSLLTAIVREHPGLSIIITGAEKDRTLAEDIVRAVPNAFAYVGSSIPMLEVAGIIDNAAFYIGVDTGITHLACVLGQKSIIISNNADWRWRPLYNPNARVVVNSRRCTCYSGEPCIVEDDGHLCYRCLCDITDEAMLASVRFALSSQSRSIPNFGGWADENETTSR